MTKLDLHTVARLLGGEVSHDQVNVPGPGHSKADRSLSIKLSATSPDGFVVYSHADDDWQACRDYVCAALGLPHGKRDRPSKDGKAKAALGPIKAVYDYTDQEGVRLFQVLRFEPVGHPKTFLQRTGPDQQKWSVKGVRRVPYRLPELIEDLALDHVVFIVEGEKDVITLRDLGVPATTNPMGAGAGKWLPEFNQHFRGADVVVCGDNDDVGRAHAKLVASNLYGVARRVRVLDLAQFWPAIAEGDDITDWFDRGDGTAARLYEIAEQLPDWQRPNGEDGEPPVEDHDAPRSLAFKTLAEFVAEYVPLAYTVDPIIRGGSLYTLTARTGHGKTALLVIMALAVATGRRDILNLEVEKGRVAYLTAENPDDARMRFMIACYLLNIDFPEVLERIVILDRRERPEDIAATLTKLAKQEPFAAVLMDTLAAFFDGKDSNDAVEGGEFLRRMRPLTRVEGRPAVIVAAHPIKNAAEDNLNPYGSGAILNEVDGNLTLWQQPSTGLVRLYWQGKIRGLDFEPLLFRFEITGSPDVLDAKGRQVQLPTMRPSSAEAAEEREQASVNKDVALLKAMQADPGGTLRDWATSTGITRSSIERALARLAMPKAGKLVANTLGKWSMTKAGVKAVGEPTTKQEENSA